MGSVLACNSAGAISGFGQVEYSGRCGAWSLIVGHQAGELWGVGPLCSNPPLTPAPSSVSFVRANPDVSA